MRTLSLIRNAWMRLYSKYEIYLKAAARFILAFVTLYGITLRWGSLPVLENPLVILIIAAVCSFLPANALILAGTVFLEAAFYTHSLEAAVCGGVILFVMLLLYFCFLPQKSAVVVLTALLLGVRLPGIGAVLCGLLTGPSAIAGLLLGSSVFYLGDVMCHDITAASGLGAETLQNILNGFYRFIVKPELILTMVTLTGVFLVVYLIRRLAMKYSWTVAVLSGAVVYCLLSGMCISLLHTTDGFLWMGMDAVLAVLAGIIAQVFCFPLDYKRTEVLQFEDDDYYYYVKAVPKWSADKNETKESIEDE